MQNIKKYYVYEHRKADDGSAFYVGKGIGKRSSDKTGRNNHWKNIVKKHGYSIHLLYENLSQFEANYIEQKIIAAYGRENLCNLTDGGDGIRNPSDETRKLMSEAATGRKGYWNGKKRNPEMVKANAEKIRGRVGMTGKDHPMFGKKLSEERKKQNSKYMKNNYVFSEEQRKKISESKTGERHHMFDKNIYKFSNEDGRVFSGTQFSFRNEFKLDQSAVRTMVIGKRKSKLLGWECKGKA